MKLLIDADIPIYQLAASNEDILDWGEGNSDTKLLDFDGAKRGFQDYMETLFNDLQVDDMVMCISDSYNWRKDINPKYKSNRKDVVRPELIGALREWVRAEYKTVTYPRLEADDVLGILSTRDPENTIVVSDDKDMLTLPVKVYVPRRKEMVEGTLKSALFQHAYQTLKGDSVDGYSGCPRVGDKKAREALNAVEPIEYPTTLKELFHNFYYTDTLKKKFKKLKDSGEIHRMSFNKFMSSDQWRLPLDELKTVKDLADYELLESLRMSNILWDDQYDEETQKIKLMDIDMFYERCEQ